VQNLEILRTIALVHILIKYLKTLRDLLGKKKSKQHASIST